MTQPRNDRPVPSLRELASTFLRLGTVAFGGPAAHIAMMEDEFVRRRAWLSRADFLDLVGASHLIPGPNSTELAIHLGYRYGEKRGLLVAGTCFILPAFLILWAVAWLYVRAGSLPASVGMLGGIQPVVVAVIAVAGAHLARTALRSRLMLALAVLALALAMGGTPEVVVLFTIGGAAYFVRTRTGKSQVFGLVSQTVLGGLVVPYSLPALFAYFVFVGSVLFGSGYVLVALLQDTLVDQWGWLTDQQLLDAVAVGLVTPGPVFTTATFIGYVVDGGVGAAVATLGIFLPSFVFVALTGPLVARLRASEGASAFLDGVNAAATVLILLVAARLAQTALTDPVAWALAIGSLVLLVGWKVNPAVVIGIGALVGVARAPSVGTRATPNPGSPCPFQARAPSRPGRTLY